MSVALRGNLEDFSIADVFQLIGQQRKTGILKISSSLEVQLAFDSGAVVWATPASSREHEALGQMLVRCGLITRECLAARMRESDATARRLPYLLIEGGDVGAAELDQIEDLLTREVFFEVLRWSTGSFHFSSQPIEHSRSSDRLFPAEQILMDGLRMVDEWRTFAVEVPSDQSVFAQSGSFEVYRQKLPGDARRHLAQTERLFNLLDGRVTTRRAIDLARVGTFEGTRILVTLQRAGMIDLVESAQKRSLVPDVGGSVGPMLRSLRVAAAAVVPMALLAGVVWLVLAQPGWLPHREEPAGFALPDRAIGAARVLFQTRRLRHAIEAHRYLTGELPESLAALDAAGIAAPGSLTPSATRPYHYTRTGDEFVLVASER